MVPIQNITAATEGYSWLYILKICCYCYCYYYY